MFSIYNELAGLSPSAQSKRDVQGTRGYIGTAWAGWERSLGTAGRARRSDAAAAAAKLTKPCCAWREGRAEYWQHLLPLSQTSFPRTFPSREAASHLARPARFRASYCRWLFQIPGENAVQKERAGRGEYGYAQVM